MLTRKSLIGPLFLVTLFVIGCSSEPKDGTQNLTREEVRETSKAAIDNAMAGSGLSDVQNIMSSSEYTDVLGSTPNDNNTASPANAAPLPITQEAQGLAACRSMIAIREGRAMRAPTSENLQQAARDLEANPNALGECSAKM